VSRVLLVANSPTDIIFAYEDVVSNVPTQLKCEKNWSKEFGK